MMKTATKRNSFYWNIPVADICVYEPYKSRDFARGGIMLLLIKVM